MTRSSAGRSPTTTVDGSCSRMCSRSSSTAPCRPARCGSPRTRLVLPCGCVRRRRGRASAPPSCNPSSNSATATGWRRISRYRSQFADPQVAQPDRRLGALDQQAKGLLGVAAGAVDAAIAAPRPTILARRVRHDELPGSGMDLPQGPLPRRRRRPAAALPSDPTRQRCSTRTHLLSPGHARTRRSGATGRWPNSHAARWIVRSVPSMRTSPVPDASTAPVHTSCSPCRSSFALKRSSAGPSYAGVCRGFIDRCITGCIAPAYAPGASPSHSLAATKYLVTTTSCWLRGWDSNPEPSD
jgi:hypothetical protein